MRDEHYRGEVQGCRRGRPARSVHDRRAGAGDEPGRPRPDLQAAARRAGDRYRRGDRLGRAAQPDPGLVRLRGRHGAAEPGHSPQEGRLAAQGAARHVPADEPGEQLPLAEPQDGGQSRGLRGRPGRGPAGHRPAGPDLGEVHRQRAALRACATRRWTSAGCCSSSRWSRWPHSGGPETRVFHAPRRGHGRVGGRAHRRAGAPRRRV